MVGFNSQGCDTFTRQFRSFIVHKNKFCGQYFLTKPLKNHMFHIRVIVKKKSV